MTLSTRLRNYHQLAGAVSSDALAVSFRGEVKWVGFVDDDGQSPRARHGDQLSSGRFADSRALVGPGWVPEHLGSHLRATRTARYARDAPWMVDKRERGVQRLIRAHKIECGIESVRGGISEPIEQPGTVGDSACADSPELLVILVCSGGDDRRAKFDSKLNCHHSNAPGASVGQDRFTSTYSGGV